ncbi:MAG: TolC family protein [Nitrospiraceae bacterium]|nr:MAG: TolC family protein [Nitrospiraceae bacterium]
MKQRILLILLMVVVLSFARGLYAQNGSQAVSPGEHQDEYALEDLFILALERAEQIKISEEELYIAERGRDKALSAFLPVFTAFGAYTKFSKKRVSSEGFLVQPDSSVEWGLRLDETLSLGGREFTSYRISKETITKSNYEFNTVKEEYLLQVATDYYNVVKVKRALDIAVENVKRLTAERDAARKRLQVGESTKTELLRAEAELSGARSERIKTENLLKLAKAVLAKTVGIDGIYDVKESKKTIESYRQEALAYFIERCKKITLSCLKQTALSERPDLMALAEEKKIADDEVRLAKGLYWPTVSLEGIYARNENDPSRSFELNESIFGTLRLNFPFFEGGLRVAETREAEARKRQAGLQYEELKKTVDVDVENAYLDYITQQSILESLRDQLSFASDNYNLVSKQFQHGLANSVDLIDANTLLVTAERELARAEFDYQLAVLKVKWSTGTLLKTVIHHTVRKE